MRVSPSRLALGFALLLAAAPAARGQITFGFTYADTTTGFADPTVAGSTTLGQLRKDSAVAATNYLKTILDGRGAVTLRFDASGTSGTGALASFGTGYATERGSFSTGMVFQQAATNTTAFAPPHGSGQVDFGYNWHYDPNTAPGSGKYDLTSVLVHEFGHALGFTSLSSNKASTADLGKGTENRDLGLADTYSSFDRFLQKGNTTGSGALFNTNIGLNTYGSYKGTNVSATDVAPYTGGNTQTFDGTNTNVTNNTTNGLYFGGKYATEVFGGAVPIYSPASLVPGSSGSHVNVGTTAGYGSGAVGLMNYAIPDNTQRRFQAYEIAMLMDMGWNTYNWNGTGGNWLDGVSNLADSRWRSEGITLGSSPTFTRYNKFATPNQAPILPVSGQTTANIVLNFVGGTTAYAMSNDVGTVRLSRMNFNNAVAVTLNNGALNFGLNADNTASVLVPKIVHNGAGAVTINSAIQVNNIATQTVLGSTFVGHTGLTVEGTGTGTVTLGGNITGTGGITKTGAFTLVIAGNSSYQGNTAVVGGRLEVRGSIGSTTLGQVFVDGNTSVLTGGTGAGTTLGTVNSENTSVTNGGTVRPDSANGTNTLTIRKLALAGGAKLEINLGASGASSRLAFNSVGTLNFNANGSASVVKLTGLGLANPGALTSWTLGTGLGPTDLQLNGATVADGATVGLFTATGAAAGNNTGNVTLDVSSIGFNFTSGDTFTLRRSGSTLVLDFAPVPEPATVLAVGAAGLGAVSWLRRRRKAAAEPTAAA